MTRPATNDVEVVPRQIFLDEIWDYSPGQHATILGPTQRGKTELSHQLLGKTISPEHHAVLLAGKPPERDHTMTAAGKRLKLREVEEWPPNWNYKDRKRNGYILRPRQEMKDIKKDDANVRDQFRKAILGNYRSKKPVITVVDEGHHVQKNMRLMAECEAPLMRGAPVNGMWTLAQRGRYLSMQVYDAPEHIFIFLDADRDNQKRYGDISGVDPRFVAYIVSNLKTYRVPTGDGRSQVTISECLYIQRSGPELYIIDVK